MSDEKRRGVRRGREERIGRAGGEANRARIELGQPILRTSMTASGKTHKQSSTWPLKQTGRQAPACPHASTPPPRRQAHPGHLQLSWCKSPLSLPSRFDMLHSVRAPHTALTTAATRCRVPALARASRFQLKAEAWRAVTAKTPPRIEEVQPPTRIIRALYRAKSAW